MDKLWKIKDMVIWAYLCSMDKPLSIIEIRSHYQLSEKRTLRAILQLIHFDAIEQVEIDGKILYQANKDTYYHTEFPGDE
jgi:DNA-binding transcriptional regulator GbsR (MarR family)